MDTILARSQNVTSLDRLVQAACRDRNILGHQHRPDGERHGVLHTRELHVRQALIINFDDKLPHLLPSLHLRKQAINAFKVP